MSKPKTHFESIRLYNNAGMSFPECYTTGAGPLDLDKSHLKTSGHLEEVDCLKCLALFPKNYGWAMTEKNRKILKDKGVIVLDKK